MSLNFETRVRNAMADLLADVDSRIEIDSIDEIKAVEGAHGRVLLVDFHVDGEWASPAGFTFPFDESAPFDQSVRLLNDMIARNWQSAHLPPPLAPSSPAHQDFQ